MMSISNSSTARRHALAPESGWRLRRRSLACRRRPTSGLALSSPSPTNGRTNFRITNVVAWRRRGPAAAERLLPEGSHFLRVQSIRDVDEAVVRGRRVGSRRHTRVLPERLQEVRLVEVVVLNQCRVVSPSGSPHSPVHGVKP